ncbi:hypothetical protein N8I77_012153 [Diaporthe amygdali]|uniref:Carboxylic ester hydrolase n=1 Tax=Phomopsis amygdali TaxID=1214568 RepID=A0AAD9S544_PHOAM|nr:hypothetical protein N8I77_012153 [Diaporthe amygdali]
MRILLLSLVNLVIATGIDSSYRFENASLSVQSTGGLVRGVIDSQLPSVRQFLGIPYAQPPIGDLRFAAPQPAGQFGTINTTSLPLSCPVSNASGTIYSKYVLEFNLQGLNYTAPTSEDCLKLSVWAPTETPQDGGLPVLIFIYGGGFGTGGIDVPYQIPAQWVQRTQDHIVVTFNYRVNIFGFPGSAALPADGFNLGLLDQRMAVEWVAANIAAFGGDPDRMILWGQSAGAASAAVYGYSYPDDPLVRGLIQDSGTEALVGSLHPEQVASNFSFVAAKLGCEGLVPAEELACMRQVPADDIENFLLAYSVAGKTPSLSFSPVVDEKLVFSNWSERALTGSIAKIPAILGTNKDEGAFTPYDPTDPAQVAVFNQTLQGVFLCPAVMSTKIRAAAGLETYRYRYSGNFSNISPTTWLGAYHSSELPLLMGTHPNFRGNSTPEEYALSTFMQDAWVAFARDDGAALEALGWPRYDNSTAGGLIMQLGHGDTAHTDTADWLEQRC